MKGVLVSLTIMFLVFLIMCFVYKKDTKRNMVEDLWNNLFKR